MEAQTFELLKELTEACGVSGYEAEVSHIIKRHLEPFCALEYDKLGSIICRKSGREEGPRIMIPGHMDEIGFMVKSITKEGFLRFSSLGAWWSQVLLAQRVVVKGRRGDFFGVIGSKPPHILEPEERKKLIEEKDMFIDIGARDKKEVEEELGIRPGDPIVPLCPFTPLANQKTILAKAWDDRVGCAMFIEVIKGLKGHPNTVYGVGTAQEEVGCRGAKTASEVIKPDVALIAEVGVAFDVPGAKEDEALGKLGHGPQIYLKDYGMIPNLKLRDFVIQLAEEHNIPYQLCLMERGYTDGSAVHIHAEGVPSLYIGVPTRYIHSHAGIIHSEDYENAVKLLHEVVMRLDAETVKGFKP